MRLRELLGETATAGATSSAMVAVGTPFIKNKKVKTPKNPDGTAKNAQDLKGVSLFGGQTIKR